MVRNTLLVPLLLSLALPTVLAWGKDGHYAVCKITQVTLTPIHYITLHPIHHLILNSNPNFRSILVKMLYLQSNNYFQILLKVILLQFALGLMRFAIITIIVGVVLCIILIHQISNVTINIAVSNSILVPTILFHIYALFAKKFLIADKLVNWICSVW